MLENPEQSESVWQKYGLFSIAAAVVCDCAAAPALFTAPDMYENARTAKAITKTSIISISAVSCPLIPTPPLISDIAYISFFRMG
jgi:hypothetical protein